MANGELTSGGVIAVQLGKALDIDIWVYVKNAINLAV